MAQVVDRRYSVAVIGAGLMGRGIAQVFATGGYRVRLCDLTRHLAERGKNAARSDLATAAREGVVDPAAIDGIVRRIEPVEDVTDAVAETSIVVEAVSENRDSKEPVWRAIGRAAPAEAVLATNTSSYDINWFGGLVDHPERVVGTHWFCPAPIVPCVEVIPAEVTSADAVERVIGTLEELGKEPARCRSVPGFVGNRIQMAMVAEAFRCLEEGVADASEIDRIVRGSFGMRLGAYGPFETGDLNGLDTYLAVFEYLRSSYGQDRFTPPATLTDYCAQGRYGVKSGSGMYSYDAEQAERTRAERDRALYARLRARRAAQRDRGD